MVEVIWHGRGGQGAFTAARLLGAAAAGREGLCALAFPSFGPERRGAPMRAFTKMDTRPVADRCAPDSADIVVYLDETLFGPGWCDECRDGGRETIVLVNAGPARRTAEGVYFLPASAIAERALGRDIPNTALLGAVCELAALLAPQDACRAIDELMPPKLREANKAAVAEAAALARELAEADPCAPDALPFAGEGQAGKVLAGEGGAAETPAGEGGAAVARTGEIEARAGEGASGLEATRGGNPTGEGGHAGEGRSRAGEGETHADEGESGSGSARGENAALAAFAVAHPVCAEELDYDALAQTTCFDAGYLEHANAGWRSERPVLDAGRCTGCLRCWATCPDGCIVRSDAFADAAAGMPAGSAGAPCAAGEVPADTSGAGPAAASPTAASPAAPAAGLAAEPAAPAMPPIAIDYRFCKGCGICARICATHALHMACEREEAAA